MAGFLSYKTEGTYGTPVTPDLTVRVLEADPGDVDEGLMYTDDIDPSRVGEQPGYLGGRVIRPTWKQRLYPRPLATLSKHLHGAVNTSGAGPYTHAASLSATTTGLTIQTTPIDSTLVSRPFTASGCVVTGYDLECGVGNKFCDLTVRTVAQNLLDSTAAITPSIPAAVPFTFIGLDVAVNGAPVDSANTLKYTLDKRLRDQRHHTGARTILKPIAEGRYSITGSITADFDALTYWTLQKNATVVTWSATFANDDHGGTDTLTISGSMQVVKAMPKLSTNGLEQLEIQFRGGHASSDASLFSWSLVNAESTSA